MTPSEVLRGVADALDGDRMDLRMTHPKTADEPFKFLGEGTVYLGEKDGERHYYVPAERILSSMAKWLKGIRIDGQNEAAADAKAAKASESLIKVVQRLPQ